MFLTFAKKLKLEDIPKWAQWAIPNLGLLTILILGYVTKVPFIEFIAELLYITLSLRVIITALAFYAVRRIKDMSICIYDTNPQELTPEQELKLKEFVAEKNAPNILVSSLRSLKKLAGRDPSVPLVFDMLFDIGVAITMISMGMTIIPLLYIIHIVAITRMYQDIGYLLDNNPVEIVTFPEEEQNIETEVTDV